MTRGEPIILRNYVRDQHRWHELWSRYAAVAAKRAADLLVLAYEMGAVVDAAPSVRFLDRALRHARHSQAAQARAAAAIERATQWARSQGLRP